MTNLDNTPVAFALVIAAGLSTAVGAAAVYINRLVQLASKRVLAAGLGFSAGVMLYVSFVEIFVKSVGAFEEEYEPEQAYVYATLCLFAGMLLLRALSWLVHRLDPGHKHDMCGGDPAEGGAAGAGDQEQAASTANADSLKDKRLEQMGLNTAAAIAIHNFPEGLATFVATLGDPAVGATLAIAIAIHNIPEGLCVALPIYYSTGSRHKGFFWALLSGLSEPVGAFIGWLVIKATGDDMNQVVYGLLFGLVGGMMIMIALLELLPTGYRYDPKDQYVTTSLTLGMFVMALSLCIFQL
eukprot:CAMPEP_0179302330 /NCGR_PEP_ID=MMETSP0797-20121207/48008_1 /TAXON_ID=47934 /ORGANISM="Dinophysis acuminata, Strain DAEP01" /LENGTH=296 /DNA_ID=CAMNT_0021011855 /DNA_START=55 /DNA_END=945 /DNA_ORIENTATION=-